MFKKKKNPKLCIIYNWFLTKVNHWFQWYTFNDFFGLQMYIIDYAALTKDPFYKKMPSEYCLTFPDVQMWEISWESLEGNR